MSVPPSHRSRAGRPGAAARSGAADRPVPPVLLLTGDDVLATRLADLAAACDVAVEQVATTPGPRAPAWRDRRLVLVGSDALDPRSPAYPGSLRASAAGSVVVVGVAPVPGDLWPRALDIGAEHVALLPEGEPWLLDRLADAATGPPRARVVGVVGGRGGAGASTLAVTLALAAARRRLAPLLVDADPYGGGIDLLLGAEGLPGLRWRDVADVQGRLQPGLLRSACVEVDGVRLLSWGDGPDGPDGPGGPGGPGGRRSGPGAQAPAVPAAAMTAVLDAAARDADLVVVDLPRSVGDAETAALVVCHRVLLVVPAEVRAAAAAAELAGPLVHRTADLRVVVRGPSPSGLPAEAVADLLGLPLAAALPPEPGLAAALDRGEAAAVRPRGALGRFAARVVGELVVELAAADGGPRPGDGAP